jgi:transcriptional antiterminator RfaH
MMQWYVMQSKPRKEDFLYQQLALREIEAYCPCIRTQPKNPRARKIQPYFPGYLFVHVDLQRIGLTALRWMPGAVGIVMFGNDPGQVPDGLLPTLHRQLQSLEPAQEAPARIFTMGDEVCIEDGLFKGYRAIFNAYLPGAERARVLLKLVQDHQVNLVLPVAQLGRE